MDEVQLPPMPRHAVRFLARMCRVMRKRIVKTMMDDGPSIQSEAAFDSLDTIESVIPDDIWKETES